MGVGPDEPQGVGWLWELQLFALFRAASAAEKVATLIDFIEFCTACHAEGRGFEPRRSRHFSTSWLASFFAFRLFRPSRSDFCSVSVLSSQLASAAPTRIHHLAQRRHVDLHIGRKQRV